MLKLELLNGGGIIKGKEVTIVKGKRPKSLRLQPSGLHNMAEVIVKDVSWNYAAGTSSAGKAIGGAAVGGILAGPLGLAAGALLGGKKKENSIAIITTDQDVQIYVTCNGKEFQQIKDLIK